MFCIFHVCLSILGEVIKHQSLKCILNEGMPHYKNPFEKGRLIIQFLVNFPDELDDTAIQQLEAVLPPRPEIIIPDGADEVSLYFLLFFFFYQ